MGHSHAKAPWLVIWVSWQTFQLLVNGRKDLLVRSTQWGHARRIHTQDVVRLCCVYKGKTHRCERVVLATRHYQKLVEIVDHENLERLAHGNRVQTLSYLARIYPPHLEEAGAIILELGPIGLKTK